MAATTCVEGWRCPVCGEGLTVAGSALRCESGHAFDRAREGYTNLLLLRGKKPAILGDTREMVQARRRFLEQGHYLPLARAIQAHALRAMGGADGAARSVVEVGCGEGYYIGSVHAHLEAALPDHPACFYGLDISKEALRLAARRYPAVSFAVADVNQGILLAAGSVGLLLNIFAPRNPSEFARVVAPGGMLLVAIPNESHLAEARDQLGLLGIEAGKQEKVAEQLTPFFHLVGESEVSYPLDLRGEALGDLVRMTPNYWHLSAEQRASLDSTDQATVTASFTLLAWERAA